MLDLWQSIRLDTLQGKSSTQKTRKIINSKVTAGRGYVIVPRRVTGRRMTYIFPIWLWFLFPASGASVSTPMDRKTSEMSCATRDESHHCRAHVVQMEIQQRKCQKMISAKKQGDPLMLHAVLIKLEVSQTLTHRDVHPYMNLKKKTWKIRSPIATHTSLLDVRAELGSPISKNELINMKLCRS